jgi:hypothetical protein
MSQRSTESGEGDIERKEKKTDLDDLEQLDASAKDEDLVARGLVVRTPEDG